MAYADVEPFGEDRDDLRAGVTASILANVHRAKGAKATTPSDFLLFPDAPEQDRQTESDMKAAAARATRVFDAIVPR